MSHEFRSGPADITDQSGWLALYGEQTRIHHRIGELTQALGEIVPQAQEFVTLSEYAQEMDDGIGQQYLAQNAGDLLRSSRVLFEETDEIAKQGKALSNQVKFHEWEVGESLSDVEPPEYTLRAIGPHHPTISKRWTQVRGGIEVFRTLTDETSPDRTLGAGIDSQWARDRIEDNTWNIQYLQIGQIMLSEDPEKTAQAFGKSELIERLGVPPQLPPEQITAIIDDPSLVPWTESAAEICREIEPPEIGLSIDRDWQ